MTNPIAPHHLEPLGRAYLVGYFSISNLKLKEIGFYSSPAKHLSWIPDGMRAVTLLTTEVPVDDWTKGYSAALERMPKILAHPFFCWSIEAVLSGEVGLRDPRDISIFYRAKELLEKDEEPQPIADLGPEAVGRRKGASEEVN